MHRGIICFLIIASLILCSTSLAFANPLDPWTSVQADRVTNGVVSIDNTLSNVYTALSALYNYLKNNGDGVVEGLLVLANRVSNIISTIDYYLPNINTNLQNIYSSLAAHSGSNLDLWGLTNSILTNTNALATGQLGIAQDVYNISGYTNAIQSKLTTLNSTEISSLSKLTNIDANVDQVESQLNSVNSNLQSLESINWRTSSDFVVQYSYDNITYYNLSDLPTITNQTGIYLKFYNNNIRDASLLKVSLNFYPSVAYQIENNYNCEIFYGNFPINDFTIFNNFRSTDIIFKPYHSTVVDSTQYIIHLYFNSRIYSSYLDTTFQYLNYNDSDFYVLDQYIQSTNKNTDTTLSDIKNILIDIDNNSDFIQNNNDLQINVDIDPSIGQGVTGVISKIQDLLDFGISLQEFLVVLNQFDNLQWFTRLETYEQVNQDPRFSPGYIDLYD